MNRMKTHCAGVAVAALIVVATAFPGLAANDASQPAAPATSDTAPPATTPPATTPPPASVQRPAIVPKTAEPPAQQSADVDQEPRRHHRYAHRHYRRYAYWEPFPIFWPHVHHNRIFWNRIPWFAF